MVGDGVVHVTTSLTLKSVMFISIFFVACYLLVRLLNIATDL